MADTSFFDSATGQMVEIEDVPPDSPKLPPDDEIIDGEIIDGPEGESETGHTLLGSGYVPPKTDPKGRDQQSRSGPPRVDEWQDFFSRVIIRAATDWYISHAFAGIDEDALSIEEVERVNIQPEERDRIARPFAELSNKSKFMRKHGRVIVASADSFDSAITLGIWFRRVNRIAAKHRRLQGVEPRQRPARQPREPRPARQRERVTEENVSSGSGTPVANGSGEYPGALPFSNPGTG